MGQDTESKSITNHPDSPLDNEGGVITGCENKEKVDRFLLAKSHLSDGYQNTQKTIQFQDLKASTIVGLSTLFSGLIVAAAKWVLGFEIAKDVTIFSELATLPYTPLLAWSGALSVAALVLSSTCILLCIHAVLPRLPKSDSYNPYLLFPICNRSLDRKNQKIPRRSKSNTKTQVDLLSEEFDSFIRSEKSSFEELSTAIRSDYQRQLIQVGSIIYKKIKYVQFGVRSLFAQLLISAVAIVMLAVFLILVALQS